METSPQIIIEADIPYKTGAALSEYERTRCKLDLHIPPAATARPSLVWFHGGGMNEGDKAAEETPIAAVAIASHGIIVAAVNYRLSPRVSYPEYLRDAAPLFRGIYALDLLLLELLA